MTTSPQGPERFALFCRRLNPNVWKTYTDIAGLVKQRDNKTYGPLLWAVVSWELVALKLEVCVSQLTGRDFWSLQGGTSCQTGGEKGFSEDLTLRLDTRC